MATAKGPRQDSLMLMTPSPVARGVAVVLLAVALTAAPVAFGGDGGRHPRKLHETATTGALNGNAASVQDQVLTWFVSGVAHTRGLNGSFWVTDLTVFNRGTGDAAITLHFNGAAAVPPIVLTLASRQQVVLEDVLVSGFALPAEDVGAIKVESGVPLEVHARTYSRAADECSGDIESYGQSYPGVEPEHALPGTAIGYLTGLRSDGAYRSNLELVNAGDEDAEVEVQFFDDAGAPVGQPLVRTIAPERRVGVTAGLPPGHPSAYAQLRVWPSEGRVIAFGSVVDGTSNDPTTVPVVEGPPVVGFEGTWEGTVTSVGVSDWMGTAAWGCGADYLRERFSAGGEVQLTFAGERFTVDRAPAYFGSCAGGAVLVASASNPWGLSCDWQAPFATTCANGATVAFPQASSNELGVSGMWVAQTALNRMSAYLSVWTVPMAGLLALDEVWVELRIDLTRTK